ncbi:MAG: HlyD family secretion protein [Anaerolineae bacterium]
MNPKRLIYGLLLPVLALALLGCNLGGSGEETAAPEATDIPPVIETSRIVSAEAFLIPAQEANIAFDMGGRVVEVPVAEGDAVTTGQILARLDDTDARAAIAVAEAALAQAEAGLNSVKAGPTAEQIGLAEAAVVRAEAALAQIVAGPPDATPEQIAVAQARINTLQTQLNQIRAGARPETVEASLASVKQAENALALAQSDYDKIAYAADSDLAQPIALALQNATLTYQAALAQHQALVNGATPEEIAVMQAQLAEGQAALEQILAGPAPTTAEQIAVAQAGVLEAEAALAQAKAGPTAEQIAVAEAGVQQAEAALQQAKLALNHLQLTAPFNGTLTNLNLEPGEIATPGAPIATVADITRWKIETDDLTEIDIVKVVEGQTVNITFDALPGETFSGVVSLIKPRSELKAGDVTYTVVITIDDGGDPRLRWGMTAFVEINVE